MQRDAMNVAPFYKGWDEYQKMLVEAVAPLTTDQLSLRAAPSQRPAWLIAAHIIGTRVGWLQGVLGEGDPALAAYDPWDADGAPARTAAELVEGLEATWRMIAESLDRWTPENLSEPITRSRGGTTKTLPRQWILWHVIEHDIHHGGELFLTLGIHGLATPDM